MRKKHKNNFDKNEEEVEKKEKHETCQDTQCQDAYLRVVADFKNYKRRVDIERASWIQETRLATIRPLLVVLDDLIRAIDSCEKQDKSDEQQKLLEGLELTQKNITKVFKDIGVEEIDSSGQFDPELHEALVQVDSPDNESGAIVEVITKGYTLDSVVLRHAQVSVAK